MSASVRAASALARVWVRCYTARLPDALRDSRRAEMDADLWDHRHDGLVHGATAATTATEIVLRTCLGVLDDLAWRFEVLRAARGSSDNGRISMLQFTSRQTQWMGLAGLAGGLLWAINVLSLVQRSGAEGLPEYPVLPVLVAALLLIGLVGFLTSYRGRLGRKGIIGVWLLVTSQASFFLANTLLGVLPAGTGREILGIVLGIGFALLPIPGFILIGLALEGPARAGAFLIAAVGPLGMLLPSVLAKLGIADLGLLHADSPVSLTYGIYFMLAAAWLAAAGYMTFRQAQSPVSKGPVPGV